MSHNLVYSAVINSLLRKAGYLVLMSLQKNFTNEYMHSRDIHFLLFYSLWTLRSTPIQLVSVLFIAALYTVPTLI